MLSRGSQGFNDSGREIFLPVDTYCQRTSKFVPRSSASASSQSSTAYCFEQKSLNLAWDRRTPPSLDTQKSALAYSGNDLRGSRNRAQSMLADGVNLQHSSVANIGSEGLRGSSEVLFFRLEAHRPSFF